MGMCSHERAKSKTDEDYAQITNAADQLNCEDYNGDAALIYFVSQCYSSVSKEYMHESTYYKNRSNTYYRESIKYVRALNKHVMITRQGRQEGRPGGGLGSVQGERPGPREGEYDFAADEVAAIDRKPRAIFSGPSGKFFRFCTVDAWSEGLSIACSACKIPKTRHMESNLKKYQGFGQMATVQNRDILPRRERNLPRDMPSR